MSIDENMIEERKQQLLEDLGKVKLKYEVGQAAYRLREDLALAGGFNEPRQRAIGGAAFGAVYLGTGAAINKGLELITETLWRDFQANVADGTHHRKIEAARQKVADGVRAKVVPQVEREAKNLNRKHASKIFVSPEGTATKGSSGTPFVSSSELSDEIKKRTKQQFTKKMDQYDNKVKKKLKGKMTKAAGKKWDEITKALIKHPKRTATLGRYLGQKFPWLAAKLVGSTAATAFPEVISSVVGLAGYGWLAWDIVKIIQDYPEMGTEIDKILRGPKSTEDKFVTAAAG